MTKNYFENIIQLGLNIIQYGNDIKWSGVDINPQTHMGV